MEREATLRLSDEQLTGDAELARLHACSTRLICADSLPSALEDVLLNAMAACGADFGNIRLYNPATTSLEIIVQRGFSAEYLARFWQVAVSDDAASRRIMESGQRWIIEDIERDPEFTPYRAIAAAAGFRSVQVTPLRAFDGGVVGLLSTHYRAPHRITGRDERLLDLYARLATGLVVRHHFEDALKVAERRRIEMVTTLAAQLHRQLEPIRAALEFVHDKRPDDPVVELSRQRIERQLGDLTQLLDDLVDVDRVSRDRVTLRVSRVALAAVLENAIEASKPQFDAGAHQLAIVFPQEPVHVDADGGRLSRAFTGLLNTAATHAQRGGRILVTAERHGPDVVLAVSEECSGIDMPAGSAQGDVEADAIGLLLSRRLVELHGGTVTARPDSAGRGSELVVRLPAASRGDSAAADGRPAADLPATRFLVVDGDRDAADSLSRVLESMGHETRVASDGEEALAAAVTFRPDVIVLSLNLLKMSGYEVCRRIRSHRWGEGMTILALRWPDDALDVTDVCFDGVLVRPVVVEEVLASVSRR